MIEIITPDSRCRKYQEAGFFFFKGSIIAIIMDQLQNPVEVYNFGVFNKMCI